MTTEPTKPSETVKAVILVASRDFGRCPLATRLPTALWPVDGKPALERLLEKLAEQGIREVAVCTDGEGAIPAESVKFDPRLRVSLLNAELPVGTAGAVRDAAARWPDCVLVIVPANIIHVPDINNLVTAHKANSCELTIALNPGHDQGRGEQSSGIYVAQRSILRHIPPKGYFDLKEGLIPKLVRAGGRIRAVTLPQALGNFRNATEYLQVLSEYLDQTQCSETKSSAQLDEHTESAPVFSQARLVGPVKIMPGASVGPGTVIIGPSFIGADADIGPDCLIANCVLWDRSRIGPGSRLQHCVVDYDVRLPANTSVRACPIARSAIPSRAGLTGRLIAKPAAAASRLNKLIQPYRPAKQAMSLEQLWEKTGRVPIALLSSVLLAAFLWAHWPNLKELWEFWSKSDEYSSGLLVPFLAGYVLWAKRHRLWGEQIRPAPISGMLALVGAQAVRFAGLFLMLGSAERLSLVLTVGALAIMLLGWAFFKRILTVWLFLFLMLPLPYRIHSTIAQPLQSWATSSAVFLLEVLGYEVVRDGNVIHIGQTSVAILEACNGLRMVTAFFVVAGLVVLLVKRPLWEKVVVFASSLPIALLCNSIRLTITSIAFTQLQGENWERIFHDFGGYAMMPLAILAIITELWFLKQLTTPPTPIRPVIITPKASK